MTLTDSRPRSRKPKRSPKLERRAFKISEVAVMLSVDKSTVYAICRAGLLKYFRVQSEMRVSAEALDAYIHGSAA